MYAFWLRSLMVLWDTVCVLGGGISDFACAWDPFPPVGLPCSTLIGGFVPSLL